MVYHSYMRICIIHVSTTRLVQMLTIAGFRHKIRRVPDAPPEEPHLISTACCIHVISSISMFCFVVRTFAFFLVIFYLNLTSTIVQSCVAVIKTVNNEPIIKCLRILLPCLLVSLGSLVLINRLVFQYMSN